MLLHFLVLHKIFRVVLYRRLFEVGLIAVFAEEGPKKGVGLTNGGFLVGLQSGGEGVVCCDDILSKKNKNNDMLCIVFFRWASGCTLWFSVFAIVLRNILHLPSTALIFVPCYVPCKFPHFLVKTGKVSST